MDGVFLLKNPLGRVWSLFLEVLEGGERARGTFGVDSGWVRILFVTHGCSLVTHVWEISGLEECQVVSFQILSAENGSGGLEFFVASRVGWCRCRWWVILSMVGSTVDSAVRLWASRPAIRKTTPR